MATCLVFFSLFIVKARGTVKNPLGQKPPDITQAIDRERTPDRQQDQKVQVFYHISPAQPQKKSVKGQSKDNHQSNGPFPI
jgi:hypothetical protein